MPTEKFSLREEAGGLVAGTVGLRSRATGVARLENSLCS